LNIPAARLKKTFFFSIKWKTLIIISVVFSFISISVGMFIFSTGSTLFQQQIANSIKNNSSALLAQQQKKLIEIGTSIAFLGGSAGNNTDQALIQYIDKNWDLMELEWGIEYLAILDLTKATKDDWGDKPNFDIEAFIKDEKSQGPITNITCQDRCLIYAKIPIFMLNGEKKFLVIAMGLVDFILNFAEQNDLKAALLRSQMDIKSTQSIKNWGLTIDGMTQRNEYRQILDRISALMSFDEIKSNGGIINSNGSTYYLHAIELYQSTNQGDDYLLLASDITAEKSLLRESMAKSIILACVGLLSSILILFYVLNGPMRRIQHQAKLLPLLAKKEFALVRSSAKSNNRNSFTHNELDILEDTAVQLSVELEKLNMEIDKRTNELERMALYDVLTELANRRMFIEQLRGLIFNSKRYNERFVVVFIDLDNFKKINDTLGHDVGDELLVEVSKRLKSSVRDSDIVARLGGDEFTLLLPQVPTDERAKIALSKVLAKFQKPMILGGSEYTITTSIGAAIGPDHGSNADELMRCADIAMYKAKKNGKNCFYIYSHDMGDSLKS